MVRLKGRQISKLTKNNYNQGVKSLRKEHVSRTETEETENGLKVLN